MVENVWFFIIARNEPWQVGYYSSELTVILYGRGELIRGAGDPYFYILRWDIIAQADRRDATYQRC